MLLQNICICSTQIPTYSLEKQHAELLKHGGGYCHKSQSLKDQCQHRQPRKKNTSDVYVVIL